MRAVLLVLLLANLAACDQLGIEPASAIAARREADGKAIGAGCRHAARSVEQCYEQNRRADKAAVFAGWREMNDYMRENKIEAQAPPPAVEVAAADDAESGQSPGAAQDGKSDDNQAADTKAPGTKAKGAGKSGKPAGR